MSNKQSNALLRDYGCNSLNELLELTTLNAMYDLLEMMAREYLSPAYPWQHPEIFAEHLNNAGKLPPAEMHRRRREVVNLVQGMAIKGIA